MTAQLPTIPGKVDGIVGWEPCVLQCRTCGITVEQDHKSVATFIILSGFRFHTCNGPGGGRMCPECLSAATADCSSARCKS